jgi:hypothetical protein
MVVQLTSAKLCESPFTVVDWRTSAPSFRWRMARTMYERFTDRARKVMQLANQEAHRYNHESIDTEHVLLGMIKEGSGVATHALKSLDVDIHKIRVGVEKQMHSGVDRVTMGKLPLMPRAKLNHDYVGTEHILLGLMREQSGVASRVLLDFGMKLEVVRQEILNLLGPPTAEPTVPKAEIQDLPAELRQIVAELDIEIRRLTLEKEEALAGQDFEKYANFRDQVDRLKKQNKAVIRDWIVNRPVEASWLSWNGGLVTRTAQIISDNRRWEDLPILADFLEAAGCTDAEMLEHCRGGSAHTSHCWVLDVLLANVSGAADE